MTRYSSGNNVAGGVDLVNQSRPEVTEELEGRLVKLHESNALTQAVNTLAKLLHNRQASRLPRQEN